METYKINGDAPICERCLWWARYSSLSGHCKRMPPVREETGEGFWPMTGRSDWCGEFSEKAAGEGKG